MSDDNNAKLIKDLLRQVEEDSEGQLAVDAEQSVEGSDTSEEVNIFTDEAYEWMTNPQSIPGAYAPILYCGIVVPYNLSLALGRVITITEAQKMVIADGPEIACMTSGRNFQPVRYVHTCPSNFNGNFDDLPMGGQYYIIDDNLQAVSGSIFFYLRERNEYTRHNNSPYIIFLRAGKKLNHRFNWGRTYAQACDVLEKKNRLQDIRKASELLAKKMFS